MCADVDVGLDDGCKSLEKLDHSHIDLVICNAGLFVNGGLDDLNYDDIRKCFEVNALGPLRTVQALRPKLRAGSKVVVIGSLMGSISNNMNGARVRFAFCPLCIAICCDAHAHVMSLVRSSTLTCRP